MIILNPYFTWGLDFIVLLIVVVPAIQGYRKGFVYACLGFLPVVVSFFGAKILSPIFSKWLRATGLFDFFQKSVYQGLNLSSLWEELGEKAEQSQTNIINEMKIPDFLKSALLENNNSVVHSLFETEQLQDYIASYIANICLNVISVVVVTVALYIIMKLFLKALNIVAEIPIISTVNRMCGLAIGGAKGIFVVWFVGIVMTFFYYHEIFQQFFLLLEKSHLAAFLYHNNLLLLMVLKIFA